MDLGMLSPQPFAVVHGKVSTLTAVFKVRNMHPLLNPYSAKVLIMEELSQDLLISVYCPMWYNHVIQYQTGTAGRTGPIRNTTVQPLKSFTYECGVCPERSYAISREHNILSYPENISHYQNIPQTSQKCMQCPYGGLCSGNIVLPRPNYWGYWHRSKLNFQQCPAGYCCSGSDITPCKDYNSCTGNRTGTLCGACRNGFSVGVLSGKCVPDSQCGGDQWFWLLAVIVAIAYTLWYTFKDDLMTLIFLGAKAIESRITCHINIFNKNKYVLRSMSSGKKDVRSHLSITKL